MDWFSPPPPPKVTLLIQTSAFLEGSEFFQIINMQAHLPHRICIHVQLAYFHLCPSVWMALCLIIKHDGLWWVANICLFSLLYTTWSDTAIQKCNFKNNVKASHLWQSILYFISVQYLQSTLKHVSLTKSTIATKSFRKMKFKIASLRTTHLRDTRPKKNINESFWEVFLILQGIITL